MESTDRTKPTNTHSQSEDVLLGGGGKGEVGKGGGGEGNCRYPHSFKFVVACYLVVEASMEV